MQNLSQIDLTLGKILAEEDNVVKREYEDDLEDELESTFYVEKNTRFIYEVKFFPEFALVRPAHPDFAAAVERMPLVTFANNFEEYFGDAQAIRDYLWGADVDGVQVEKK